LDYEKKGQIIAILVASSDVFDRLFCNGMKEGYENINSFGMENIFIQD
jgi:hypothetical protein